MKKKLVYFCLASMLIAGGLGVYGGSNAAYAVDLKEQSASHNIALSESETVLNKIKFIGNSYTSTLGFGEIESDGKGNFITTRYMDDRAAYIQPVYQVANAAADSNLSVRVIIESAGGKKISKIPLLRNIHDASVFDQKKAITVAHPGKKYTRVISELYNGKTRIGTFVINFAPASEQPAGFMPIIDPEGKYAAPKNVRVENGLLKWDSVEKAERYGIYAYLCDSNGTAVKLVDIAEMDSTETLEVPVDEIASFLELPTGNYRFAVKASSVHNGFWNATLGSDLSKKTELVLVN